MSSKLLWDQLKTYFPLRLPFHWLVWVRDALRCDDRAAELKIDLIQSQCDLSMDAHVAISAFIHRAFTSPFVILYLFWLFSVMPCRPSNTRRWTSADSMLDYRLRCWTSMNFIRNWLSATSHICQVAVTLNASPVGLYNIYTMLEQRRRRWADVAYMLSLSYCIVFTGRVQWYIYLHYSS